MFRAGPGSSDLGEFAKSHTPKYYREVITSSPYKVNTIGGLLTSHEGEPLVAIAACYNGSLEESDKVLRPIRSFGPALADHMSDVLLPGPDTAGFRGSARGT
jgi:hypothetical protein